jgi:hypothetical protein
VDRTAVVDLRGVLTVAGKAPFRSCRRQGQGSNLKQDRKELSDDIIFCSFGLVNSHMFEKGAAARF